MGLIFKLIKKITYTIGQLMYQLRLAKALFYFCSSGTWSDQSTVVKGCASKAICDTATSVGDVQDISCCEGNLCNGDKTVTQSFIQSVTQSFVYNNAKDVEFNDAKSRKKSFMDNDADSVI